jgi:archaellum component FlaF (FlaF/FlaG flagellin family)
MSQPAHAASTERVSVASDGSQGNGDSERTAISADGRYVGFDSSASNLVPGDTNAVSDTFVRDRKTGTTRRVSVSGFSQQGNGDSYGPSLSADGRYVAFRSHASNLIPGDSNGVDDDFVSDRQGGTIERVSVDSSGVQADGPSAGTSISADGRYVAFLSLASNLVPGDTNRDWDVFVHDMKTGTTKLVSVAGDGTTTGNGDCDYPQISADGRYVAFRSEASNLVAGDSNGAADIFIRDLQTGITKRISVNGAGAQANGQSWGATISGDGRYIAFRSAATNLVSGDTNGVSDVFVHDAQSGATERVSVASDGSEGNGDSYGPSISDDGRYVAYRSAASNLVPGDSNSRDDIFRYDRQAATTERVSLASSGAQANGNSYAPFTNADGRFVVFWSGASNLVIGDTNGSHDGFLRDTVPAAAPPAPTFTGTDPNSPANDNSPKVLGSAPPGSTVNLYASADCTGQPAATGTATRFASPGIAVSVPDDSSTTFHATAIDADGNASACSRDSITYVEDSTAPDTTITPGLSETVDSHVVTFTFASSEAGSSFACRLDSSTWAACASSRTYRGLANGAHTFSVRATDPAGNPDRSPASQRFIVDTRVRGYAHASKMQKQKGKRIVVKFTVKSKEDLSANASGQVMLERRSYKLKPKSKPVPADSARTLKLKPRKGRAADEIAGALNEGKRARAKVEVGLSDIIGNEKTEKLRVKLKQRT